MSNLKKAQKNSNESLLNELNRTIKRRFDIIELSYNDLIDKQKSKEFLTIVATQYLKAIKALNIKKKSKTNTGLKKVKSFLKTANDIQLQKIIKLIEELSNEKNI